MNEFRGLDEIGLRKTLQAYRESLNFLNGQKAKAAGIQGKEHIRIAKGANIQNVRRGIARILTIMKEKGWVDEM